MSEEKITKIELNLNPEAYANLKKLQEMCGHKTLAETIRKSLHYYMKKQQEQK